MNIFIPGFLAALLAAGNAFAAEVEAVKLADKLRLSDTSLELVLNGAGLRARAFFRVYVGALYLQQKTSSAQAAIAGAAVYSLLTNHDSRL